MNIRHGISLLTFWFYLPLWGADQPFEKIAELTTKAEKGDASAQNELGEKYYYGKGVKRDFKEALKWYLKSAEQGLARAQFNLGYMYDEGQGVPNDDKEAIKWFRKAAGQGYAWAQYRLGDKYYRAEGVEQDDKEALRWHRKAAGQGDGHALLALGAMYWHGKGVEKNISRAYLWWSLAAEKDLAAAKIAKRHAKLKLTPEQIKKIDQLEKQWSVWKLVRGWPENPQDAQGPFATLEKKFGFRVHWRQGDVLAPRDSQIGQAKEVGRLALKRLPDILRKALAKYPPWVIQKHLNHVRFAEDLYINGKKYGGTVDYKTKSIYVDVAIKDYSTSVDIENIIHHEFATFMMDIHDFPANAWIKFNPPGFEYEDPEGRGSNVIGKKRGPPKKFWPLGFVRGYSQASLDNDFENFSALIFSEPRKAKLLINNFPKLKEKYRLWLKVHQKIDENFFTEEQLFPKNLFAQKQPEKVEEIEILKIKDTHYCLPTGKPYSGKVETRHDNGKLHSLEVYKNGEQSHRYYYQWYTNNNLKSAFRYRAGKLHGPSTWWYDNGQKKVEAIYRDGKHVQGTVRHWNPDGTPK